VTAISLNWWGEPDQRAIREQLVRIVNSGLFTVQWAENLDVGPRGWRKAPGRYGPSSDGRPFSEVVAEVAEISAAGLRAAGRSRRGVEPLNVLRSVKGESQALICADQRSSPPLSALAVPGVAACAGAVPML
jgi:hypothetical protein